MATYTGSASTSLAGLLKALKKQRMTAVVWKDHHFESVGWVKASDTEAKPHYCFAAGPIVKETDEVLILSVSVSGAPGDDDGEWCMAPLAILKSEIVKRARLPMPWSA